MANERKWFAVSALFAADGTLQGKIIVPDVAGFYVKSQVRIVSNTQSPQLLEIKRIEGTTDIYVGRPGESIDDRVDMSAYILADSAQIILNEQRIPTIKAEDIQQAIYAREPIVALRNILVDRYGRYYDASNPLPVNASFSGSVTIALDALTPPNKATPDNVLVSGSEDGTKGGIKRPVRVDSALDLRVGISNGANKAGVNASGEVSTIDAGAQSLLTSANGLLTNIQTILTAIDAGIPGALGQQTMAGSMSVTIASNQTAIPTSDTALQTLATAANLLLSNIQTILTAIDAGIPATLGSAPMAGSMPVTIATDQGAVPVTGPLTDAQLRANPVPVTATLADEPIKISGTENGQPNGTEFTIVNNLRLQILAAKDRVQSITYADFGTKNQRVTQIDYTAPSIGVGPGFTARKSFTYTLVGVNYRRDLITWSLV